jgi:hypothetical protein
MNTSIRTLTGSPTAAVALSLALSALAPAQSPWAWQAPTTAPAPMLLPSMAFDPNRNVAIAIGGFSFETWVYDGTSWTSSPGNPAPLVGGAMAFDGTGIIAASAGTTSRWDGSTWQTLNSSAPNYGGIRLAFDESRSRVVAFGGSLTPFALSNETWEWDGSTWTRRNPTTVPPARNAHAMAYHRLTQRIVMFGGESTQIPARAVLADTWTWDGTNWTQETGTAPSARSTHTLTGPDPVVLHGGADASNQPLGDTWEWTGTTWQVPSITGTARPRATHAAALFETPAGNDLIVYEGFTSSTANEVQILEVGPRGPRASVTVLGAACPGTTSPQLSAAQPPRINSTFTLDCTNALPNQAAVFLFGLDGTFLGLPLPLDLTPFGFTGCEAQAGPDLLAPVSTSAAGQASVSVIVPNDFNLAGQTLWVQAMITDPNSSPWDASLTNGLICVLGF